MIGGDRIGKDVFFCNKWLYGMVLLWVASASLALPLEKSPHSVRLTIDFQLYQKNQKQRVNTTHFMSVVGMSTADHKCIQLNSVQSQPVLNASPSLPHGFPTFSTVLVQFKKADHQQLVVKFLILHLNGKFNVVLEPTVVTTYGKKSIIRFHEENQYVELQVLATPDHSSFSSL